MDYNEKEAYILQLEAELEDLKAISDEWKELAMGWKEACEHSKALLAEFQKKEASASFGSFTINERCSK